MKVVLLQDVKSLGKKDDIVEISEGYARNFVLPKKLGVEATPKNLNDIKLKKANEEKIAAEKLAEAKEFAKVLETKTVICKIKTGEGGKSFGSVSTKEIAVGLKEQHDMEIDKKKIDMKDPIKSLGMYQVVVKVHPKVSAKLNVSVVEE